MWALFKNDSKRLVNIFVLLTGFYLLGYLLSGFSNTNSLLFVSIIFYSICSIGIFTVVMVNFKYLHEKTSATHILSLPLTKVQICLAKYLSGLCTIVIPSLFFIVAIGITLSIAITNFMISALLFILIYYTLGCIVANMTGKTIMHITIYTMVCFIPMLLYVALSTTIAQYVHGMNGPDISMTLVYLLLPGSYLVQTSFNIVYILVFLGYSIGLFIIMLYIATIRPFEKTGEAVAFDKIDDIVKFLMITSFSWLLMSLIAITVSGQEMILPVICIFSTIVVTVIMELIFFKKIKIKRTLLQITSIFVITVAVFFATSKYFQYYMPSSPENIIINFNGYYGDDPIMESNNPQTIAMVKEIHEYLMGDPAIVLEEDGRKEITIQYQEDYSRVSRKYRIDTAVYMKIKDIFNNNIEGYHALMNSYYSTIEKALLKETTEEVTFDIFGMEDKESFTIDKQEVNAFKQKLKTQFQRFKERPELYQEIDFINQTENPSIHLTVEENRSYYYQSYKNDPVYYAIIDYIVK